MLLLFLQYVPYFLKTGYNPACRQTFILGHPRFSYYFYFLSVFSRDQVVSSLPDAYQYMLLQRPEQIPQLSDK